MTGKNKIMILIHGVLTPWQIWKPQIDYFKDNYHVVVPALDAHIENEKSEFVSIEKEAEMIEEYVNNNFGGRVYALCGLSMGGKIANRISLLLYKFFMVIPFFPILPQS